MIERLMSVFDQLTALLGDPLAWVVALLAMALGVILGALPGLTAPMAMALLLGVAYTMPVKYSITAMMLIYMGGAYGGSMSAILLNVPGAPASAATALDGYPLARQGMAGRAIAMATISSTFGSLIAVGMMAVMTPWLVDFSLLFTGWELLLLVLLGILVAGSLSSDDPLKGWMSGFIGLLLAQIGMDDIHMYSRFSFGSTYLDSGIGLICTIVGIFGLSEVMTTMRARESRMVAITSRVVNIFPSWWEIRGRIRLIIQSGVIGTFIGILPGLGADMGGWVAYDVAKRTSKTPERFGKGSMEGVMAAETGNNAVVPGSIIPVIALGLPGSGGAAIIMAALFLHGLKPGPTFMIDNIGMFEYMVSALFLGSLMLLIVGLTIAHVIGHVLKVPRENIMAVIIALASMGSYASKLQFGDLWMMIFFGVLAYGMRRLHFPVAPLVLGVVLGRLLDEYLRQALMISGGSLRPIYQRPICLILTLVILFIVTMGIPAVKRTLINCFRRFISL